MVPNHPYGCCVSDAETTIFSRKSRFLWYPYPMSDTDPQPVPYKPATPLVEAIQLDDEEESVRWVQELLDAGEDPNVLDPFTTTRPFSESWYRGSLKLMQLLVEYGADPLSEPKDFDGLLILANSYPCTKYMWEHGHRFDQLSEDRDGEYVLSGGLNHPLTVLLDHNAWELIEKLKPLGLLDTINVIEECSEETPLAEMVRQQKIEHAEWLLEHGARPNHRWSNRVEYTPLDHAVKNQDINMVKLLIQHSADPHIRTWMNISALDRAKTAVDESKSYRAKQHAKMVLYALQSR